MIFGGIPYYMDFFKPKYCLAETRTRKAAHTTMVTTFGLKKNMYQAGILFEVTLDELFE